MASWLDEAMAKYGGITEAPPVPATSPYVDPLEQERLKRLQAGKQQQTVQPGSSSSSGNVGLQFGLSTQQPTQQPVVKDSGSIGEGFGLKTSNRDTVPVSERSMRAGIGESLLSSLMQGLGPERTNDATNIGIGQLVGAAFGPVGSGVYNVARAFGFNPAQGISEMNGGYAGTPGFQGGFWGKQGIGEGIDPYTQQPAPVETRVDPSLENQYYQSMLNQASGSSSGQGWGTGAGYSSSGNANYSPYGGASYSES